jgi:uncharacterized protein (TIGR03435 family)
MARRCGLLFLLLFGSMAFPGLEARAQTGGPSDAKVPTFDVVTIKPNDSGKQGGAWGVNQNKYTAKNTPLSRVILQAYLGMFPSGDRLKGAPAWVSTDPYDITAKVDDATADLWKGKRQAEQVAIAAPMLRAMLVDRCKLVAHTVPTEIDGYALVIGKHGTKMKQAEPDEPLPKNYAKFEGGWMVVFPSMKGPDAKQTMTYLQVTMAQFTEFISLGGKPIVDQTGLAGKWDFEVPLLIDPNAPEAGEGGAPAPRPDAAHVYDWGAIGLELKPITVPALDLVVDHIERPTGN